MSANENAAEEKWVTKGSIIGAIVGAVAGAAFGQLFLGDAVGLGPVAFLPVAAVFGVGGFMGGTLLE